MVEIREVERKLTEADIVAAEREVGVSFPAEYRRHLLLHNGGRPVADAFDIPEQGYGSIVDWFLAIYDGEYDNLLDYVRTYRGRIPDHMIPIAHDPGGNLICICVAGPETGAVYFWDHELEWDPESGEARCDLFRVATTLGEFLGSLRASTPA